MDDVTYTGDITYAGYVTCTGDATYGAILIHIGIILHMPAMLHTGARDATYATFYDCFGLNTVSVPPLSPTYRNILGGWLI